MKIEVNYIRHLAEFFTRADKDANIRPNHISLYMALFRWWNELRFINPFRITRSRLMHTSKIGTKACYSKCIHELSEWGYISYRQPERVRDFPEVIIHGFPGFEGMLNSVREETDEELETSFFSGLETGPKPVPFNKPIHENENQNEKTVPSLAEASAYFSSAGSGTKEAEKFYAHYEANGWLQGGRTPIRNWQAAADKWMLNARHHRKRNNTPPPPNPEDYGTPL